MRVRWFMLGLAVVLCISAKVVNAAIVITTNMGGADADVRAHEITDDAGQTIPTRQRGASQEVAVSSIDNGLAASDRTNVTYYKFKIDSLPDHNSDPGFWATNKELKFRLTVRNTSFTNSRLIYPAPTSTPPAPPTPAELYRATWHIRGLEPGHTYADDTADPNTFMRQDRSLTAPYPSPQYRYEWNEGNGTGAALGTSAGQDDPSVLTSGITWLDAPGITPFCMAAGSCNTSIYGGANGDIFQSLGTYDDFNSDTRMIGSWKLPSPEEVAAGTNRLPVGQAIDYVDTDGALRQLIFDAQDAGRSSITLIVSFGLDPRLDASSTPGTTPPVYDGPNPGVFPANTFLNFSYAMNPKEKTSLENDSSYDPDGPLLNFDPGVSSYGTIGSPYSCSHANCNGDGTPNGDLVARTLGDNGNGRFSPQLILRVPEPATFSLLAMGVLAIAGIRRRK